MSKIYVFYRYSCEVETGRIVDEPEVLGYTEDKERIDEILEKFWREHGNNNDSCEIVQILCEEVGVL